MTSYGKPVFYRVLDVEFVSMLEVPISEDIKEGVNWLIQNRILFSLAVVAGITNIAGTASFSILGIRP